MNIKKLFPEKKLSRKGILEFLDKKGFYIVLILCIAIIGVTAVFLSTGGLTSPNSSDLDAPKVVPDVSDDNLAMNANDKVTAESSVSTPDTSLASKVASNTTPEANKTAVKEAEKTAPQVKDNISTSPEKKPAANKSTTSSSKTSFIVPVFGQITFDYAKDKLVYSRTLEEWRAHEGIDIAAERGTAVKAVADGVISDIKSDPRYGVTIIVEHKNGIKTAYANLVNDVIVMPNQIVKQNEVIGSVGNTAGIESAEQTHLHFEVWKNNKPQDPSTYLPKK